MVVDVVVAVALVVVAMYIFVVVCCSCHLCHYDAIFKVVCVADAIAANKVKNRLRVY